MSRDRQIYRVKGVGFLVWALGCAFVAVAAFWARAGHPSAAHVSADDVAGECHDCRVQLAQFGQIEQLQDKKPEAKKPAAKKSDKDPPEVTVDFDDDDPAEKPKAKAPTKKPAAKPKKPDADTEEEPATADEPKAKTSPKSKPAPKGKSAKAEEIPPFKGAPEGVCDICLGTQHVPLSIATGGRRPYTYVEGDKAPSPSAAVPWKHCPKCAADGDPASLVAVEAERLKSFTNTHQVWENKTGWKLVHVETRHCAIHSDTPLDMARRSANAAEALAEMLQRTTKSVYLTQTRPGTFEMTHVWDKSKYTKIITVCQTMDEFRGEQDWSLIAQCGGFNGAITCVTNINEGKQVPPEHNTISRLAQRNVQVATGGKAKPWLHCGFAYACENALTNKVLVHYLAYRLNEVRLGPDWKAETLTRLQQRKLRHWLEVFAVPLEDFNAEEHLSAFACVAYLYKTDPRKFCLMCHYLKEGKEDVEAIETAYGKKVSDLEAACAKWITTGK